VVQQLSQGDGGTVGAPLTVVEPVDDVPGEVTTGRLVELAAALIGQHQQAGGGLGNQLIECRCPADAVSSRIAHGSFEGCSIATAGNRHDQDDEPTPSRGDAGSSVCHP
jgi:hypothetical protein